MASYWYQSIQLRIEKNYFEADGGNCRTKFNLPGQHRQFQVSQGAYESCIIILSVTIVCQDNHTATMCTVALNIVWGLVL